MVWKKLVKILSYPTQVLSIFQNFLKAKNLKFGLFVWKIENNLGPKGGVDGVINPFKGDIPLVGGSPLSSSLEK